MGRDLLSTPDPFISKFIISGGLFKGRSLYSNKGTPIIQEDPHLHREDHKIIGRQSTQMLDVLCFISVVMGLKLLHIMMSVGRIEKEVQ